MTQTVSTFDQPTGASGTAGAARVDAGLDRLLDALTAVRDGDFEIRLDPAGNGGLGEIAGVFNAVVERNRHLCAELVRVRRVVGRDGRLDERLRPTGDGAWAAAIEAANGLVDELSLFTSEVTRVAREVGTEGKLGGQARVPGVSGTWRDLTDSVNFMAGNLTAQVRNIAQVTTAVARGDLSKKITVDVEARGEILELKTTINTMVDQLSAFASEVTRVAREVGSEGRLGGQAEVPGVSGTWKDLTDNVNSMAFNLTSQVRNIAQVTTAVASGDLSQKITVDARGEILE